MEITLSSWDLLQKLRFIGNNKIIVDRTINKCFGLSEANVFYAQSTLSKSDDYIF